MERFTPLFEFLPPQTCLEILSSPPGLPGPTCGDRGFRSHSAEFEMST
ncbi:hypothetical protein [Stieleria mannarensis]|nr:hypothetical protein [Rhodopirellula sp. JC639]